MSHTSSDIYCLPIKHTNPNLSEASAPHPTTQNFSELKEWTEQKLENLADFYPGVKSLFEKFSAKEIKGNGRWDYSDPDGHNYLMPARIGNYSAVKIINSRPANLEIGIDRSQSTLVISSEPTGVPIDTVPAVNIAAAKTALVGMVAVEKWIEVNEIKDIKLGIIGGGHVSRDHLKAMHALFGDKISQSFIYSPRESGKALANKYQDSLGTEFSTKEDILLECNVIISSTASKEPVIDRIENIDNEPKMLLGVGFHDVSTQIMQNAEQIISEEPISYKLSKLPLASVDGDGIVSLSDIVQGKEEMKKGGLSLFMPYGIAMADLAVAIKLLTLE